MLNTYKIWFSSLFSLSGTGTRFGSVRKMLVCVLLFLSILPVGFSQNYTDFTTVLGSPAGLANSRVAWADVDNDNDLDILVTGEAATSDYRTTIYRNQINTSGNFAVIASSSTLDQVRNAGVDFGDYNNDGFIDLVLCGLDESGNRQAKLYTGNGTGNFTNDPTATPALTPVSDGAAAFGDYDNDGDLDLVVSGNTGTGSLTRLYRNDGNSQFFEDVTASATLTAVEKGSLAWGDYDNDGDLDLLITGTGAGPLVPATTRIFENKGNSIFGNSVPSITSVKEGNAVWGDYDTDGDLDILLTGNTGSTLVTEVWRNDGSNVFVNIGAGLTGIKNGQAIWGDNDHDGDMDIVIVGQNGNTTADRTGLFYRNNSGSFTQDAAVSTALTDVNNGASVAFGDYNNDKAPDLLLAGTTSGTTTHTLKLFQNTGPAGGLNVVPPTPLNLSAVQVGSSMVFTWNLTGSSYPAGLKPGLTYNIYVGTVAGDDNIVPAMANLTTGKRRIYAQASIKGLSWVLEGLGAGTYYWGVQSVDNDFEGSAFATSGPFTFTPITSSTSVFSDNTAATFNPNPIPAGLMNAGMDWGDYNNDGFMDFVMSGATSFSVLTVDASVYKNDGDGTFTKDNTASGQLPDVYNADVAWGDYDNDGDLDIAICGELATSGIKKLEIYKNNGLGSFSFGSQASSVLVPVTRGSLDWGDYDNDGDLDLLVTGLSDNGLSTTLYRNRKIPQNIDGFEVDNAAGLVLEKVEFGDAKFGDYNNDGWLDIALAGAANSPGNNGPFSEVYRNQGDGTFTAINTTIPGVRLARLAWGDANNDGFLDLLVSGSISNSGSIQAITNVYKYVEFPPFFFGFINITNTSTTAIQPVANGSVAWGDYDDDGFLDILLTGEWDSLGTAKRVSKIYQNNGSTASTKFTEDIAASNTLTDVDLGSRATWGDFDNDKKLDIILTGRITSSNNAIFKTYKNIDLNPNVTPGAPVNLSAQLNGFDVVLSWDPPVSTPANQVSGLTYAVYVDKPGGASTVEIRSPMSNLTNGYRRIVHPGEVFHSREITLKGLPPGAYTWSVQAIDQDFEGSAFATQALFNYVDPTFIDTTAETFPFTAPKAVWQASIALGDYKKNDGYLDIALSGRTSTSTYSTSVYEYDALTDVYVIDQNSTNQLTQVNSGSVDWGDFDNDGDPDLLVTGQSASGPVTHLYENLSGAFTSALVYPLIGVRDGVGKFADYDNDGWADIIIAGHNGTTPITKLYRNVFSTNPTSPFSDSGVAFDNLTNSDADWADFDNDGYLDLALTGTQAIGTNPVSKIYRNNGNGGFSNFPISGFPALDSSSIAWGDFNADGFVDLALTGKNSSGTLVAKIYKNNAGASFTDLSAPITPVKDGSLDWGDYNNDGYKDLLITGQFGPVSSDRKATLYRYSTSTSNFEEEPLAAAPFPQVNGGSDAVWGDYDRDGKLDLMIVGKTSDSPATGAFTLLRNIDPASPTSPATPSGLSYTIEGNEVVFHWNAPANKGYSHNIYLGSSAGAINYRSPLAYLTDGSRKIVRAGQVNDTTAFRIKNLPGGNYYWGVQAIDADFQASAFASGQMVQYELPTFTDVSDEFPVATPGLTQAALEWADYDNDGDLDLLAAGLDGVTAATRLYRNDGISGFVYISGSGLANFGPADIAFGDYDNDNDLDVVIAGANSSGNPEARVYRNNGTTFTFVKLLTGVTGASVAWGDYDKDGDPDILLTGNATSGRVTQIYENTGAGNFADIAPGITPVKDGKSVWTDYNRDGFPDVLISGNKAGGTIGTPVMELFRNEGGQSFTFVTSLTGVDSSSVEIGDYNNDGYEDILVTGRLSNGARVSRVYQNAAGTGVFNQEASFTATGISGGDARWGDYNNDGWLDVVLTGKSSTGNIVEVFRNDGTGDFVKKTIAALPLAAAGEGASLAWGDFNNDKKTDLAVSGFTNAAVFRLYQNVDTTDNTTRGIPGGLTSTVSGDTVILTWTAPSGVNASIVNGLSYNLYVGTTTGGTNIVSPSGRITPSAYRRIPLWGNAGNKLVYKLRNLSAGSYFWSVQTIDQDFEPSAFASEKTFSYTPPLLVNVSPLNIPSLPFEGLSKGKIAWGDYDGDQDLDLFVTGETGTATGTTAIFENSGGILTLDNLASGDLTDLIYSSFALGDYDADGDLDMIVFGETPHAGAAGSGTRQTLLYKNNGAGRYSADVAGDIFPELSQAWADWGDYDNDGDLDLVMTGGASTGAFAAVYKNVNGTFEKEGLIEIQKVLGGSVAWGDYDADGDLDIVLTGSEGTNLYSKVYQNKGSRGGFEELSFTEAPLLPLKESMAAWSDYDNDGYLDLLLTGDSTALSVIPRTKIYRYNALSSRFELGVNLPGVKQGQGIWGDINDDGYADIVVAGKFGASLADRTTRIYLNNKSGGFSLDVATSAHLKGVDEGAGLAFGDYDQDGKLDLAVMGRARDSAPRRTLSLYRNIDPNVNLTPGEPTNLSTVASADSVVFSWDAPAGGINYTYNLYVGTTTTADNQMPAMAQLSAPVEGYRRVVRFGNVGHRTSWSLRGLDAGTYFWSVQAIDPDFEGSAFPAEKSITFTPPQYVNVTNILFNNVPEGISEGDAVWGDYDNDNDLDFAIAGTDASGDIVTLLYKNQDNRAFEYDIFASQGLQGVKNGDLTWGDYDNNGRLDLAVSGQAASGPFTRIYRNTTSSFQPINAFEQVRNSSVAFADYDDDGDPDFFLMGQKADNTAIAILYENKGTAGWATGATFPGLHSGDVAWTDFNNDGFVDFAVMGISGSTPVFAVYKNKGDKTFTNITTGLPGVVAVSNGGIDWADYDNDGDPDLLVTGTNASNVPLTQLFRNKGNETFELLSTGIKNLEDGDANWGDYDNDGWYDVLVTGNDLTGNSRIAEIYRNDHSGGFALVPLASTPLSGVDKASSAVFGDYNGDRKLDILLIGEMGSGNEALHIYRNDEKTPNTTPEPPENLQQEIVGSKLRLSWSIPSGHDPALVNGLTYNVTMGLSKTQQEIISPLSSLDSLTLGYRKVAATGNVSQVLEWDISNLLEGKTYFWSVQAIDPDFEGSEFATFSALEFTPPAFEDQTPTLFPGDPPAAVSESAITLGDYDNDGDLDILAAGDLGGGLTSTSIYTNNGGTTFAKDTDASSDLAQVRLAGLAWGDYDNDGDLDLVICGQEANNSLLSAIYENQAGRFEVSTTASDSLTDVYKASARWGDYDNDGDLDLVVAGANASGQPVLILYKNLGDHLFSPQKNAFNGGAGISSGSVDWADYDRDGWMDLLVAGETATGALTRVYHNNANGTFTDAGFTDLASVKNSSVAWGDFDNDGYADILLAGESSGSSFEAFSRVYRYNQVEAKFENIGASLVNISRGSAIWGDFDDDGWLDILLSGKDGDGAEDRTTRLYRNDRAGSFKEDVLSSSDLEDVDLGAAVFGDYDGDKKLDIILSGRTASNPVERAFAVFQNIDTAANKVPGAPVNPSHTIVGPDVTLTWSPPAGHNPSTRQGLSYNVYIGTTDNKAEITSPLSLTEGTNAGFRQVIRMGNASQRTSWTFTGIPDGSYIWGVQAIDQDFEGSVFVAGGSFEFTNPVPDITGFGFADIYTTGSDTSSYIQVLTDTIVDKVVVHFKGIAAENWSTENITSVGGKYTFPVTAAKVDEMGLEYYFEVKGTFGFDISTDTIYTYRRYPEGFIVGQLDFGKEAINYNFVSVPLVLDNSQISAVVEDDFGEYNTYEWRFWHYRSGTFSEYTQGLTTIEPGRGYSLITKENRSFNTGAGDVVEANDSQPFVLQLQQGHNEIGNPYPYNLAWNDILAAMGTSADKLGELRVKGPVGYQNGAVINKFSGGFVHADEALTLVIPVRKNPAVQRFTKSVPLVESENFIQTGGWGMNLSLKSGKLEYPLGGFGMHPGALESKDRFDAIPPPRMPQFMEMSFAHPEHFSGEFTRDIVPAAKSFIWEFAVESNLGLREIELIWDNSLLNFAGQQLILFDIENQRVVDMLEQTAYLSLSDQETRRFRIYYGSPEFVEQNLRPDFIHLGDVYPNPSSGPVTIPFTLPSGQPEYEVKVAVYNSFGQEIKTLNEAFFTEGFHEITWDGRDANGNKVAKGVYIYHLQVEDKGNTRQFTGRMLIE
ncbi:MAG: FG-GAP-like repeat-containing protein [Bacteroidia bacterium]|nr:FG-GAP-like repeat-containing protein [Bacteroidia bacterium]